ncbi:MAG: hypothetical protein ACR2J8_10420, partial [Thermomicrobiales bacterium]
LFWATLALAIVLTVQQALNGSGNPGSRTVAFIIPMLFPIGTALWGMKAGLKGPALGAMAMAILYWTALVLSPGQ